MSGSVSGAISSVSTLTHIQLAIIAVLIIISLIVISRKGLKTKWFALGGPPAGITAEQVRHDQVILNDLEEDLTEERHRLEARLRDLVSQARDFFTTKDITGCYFYSYTVTSTLAETLHARLMKNHFHLILLPNRRTSLVHAIMRGFASEYQEIRHPTNACASRPPWEILSTDIQPVLEELLSAAEEAYVEYLRACRARYEQRAAQVQLDITRMDLIEPRLAECAQHLKRFRGKQHDK